MDDMADKYQQQPVQRLDS